MKTQYLHSILKQFEYYKSLGDKTFSQLEERDLFWQYNEDSNSIAILVNHLWGNMKSRWTDFLNSDGEKEWRKRDLEFEPVIQNREELLYKWNEGWERLFDAVRSINEENFESLIFIRNQEHSIPDAVNRQLAHYSYHIGQIVFIGKMLRGKDWKSLSIRKGRSSAFNSEKFSRGKHGGHFTDDFK